MDSVSASVAVTVATSVILAAAVASTSTPGERVAAAALYALHPVTLCAILFEGGERLLENALLVACADAARRGHTALCVLVVARLCVSTPLQGLALLVPAAAWSTAQAREEARPRVAAAVTAGGVDKGVAPRSDTPLCTCVLAASYVTVLLLSVLSLGVPRPPGSSSLLAPLAVAPSSPAPELGLTWYLFSLAFLRYMPYFTWTVWLHPLLYVVPLTLRFAASPGVAFLAQAALTGLTDPSASYTLTRLPACAALIAVHAPRVVEEMRGLFAPLALAHFSLFVSPVMKHLWLSHPLLGNANFAFNHTLLFALSLGVVVTEFLAAAMRVKRRGGGLGVGVARGEAAGALRE